jgi:hypothetical protein
MEIPFSKTSAIISDISGQYYFEFQNILLIKKKTNYESINGFNIAQRAR